MSSALRWTSPAAPSSPARSFACPTRRGPRGGAADLVIAPRGGTIRYSARLSYAPVEPPREASDRGLALWRTYERVKRPGPGAAHFGVASEVKVAAGDLVRVTVHVAVP